MKNNKKAMALLMAAMMALGGCGDSKEAGASDIEVKSGLGATTDGVPDGTQQGTEEAESQTEEESPQGKAQQQEWEMIIYNDDELQIALAKLEFDDGKDEGTAYLHLENKKEDGTIHIEPMQISVDATEGDVSTDDGVVELSAGESRDIAVRFSNPNAARKISESGAIEMKMKIEGEGFDSWENGVYFFIKGNPDSMIQDVPAKLTVEEAEVYNDNGFSITVTGLEDSYSGGTELSFSCFVSDDMDEMLAYFLSVTYAEIYINDTLVMSNEPIDGVYHNGEGMRFDTEDGGRRTITIFFDEEDAELLQEEPHEITISFVIKEGAEYSVIDMPKVTIPLIPEQ